MIQLRPPAHIHLIAVCGTAMGSLAGMLRERGFRVTGSDAHVYPPMSTFLEELGIQVLSGFDAARLDPAPDLVVVGNAISRGNPEVEAALERRLPYASLPEVVRDFFLRGKRPVVVTGTHGKTTTTAMIAHLLRQGGRDPGFLVAGLPRNFPRPFCLGRGDFFVIEGDEYDSAFFAKHAKFFYYLPEILIINNIEFDHADIYEDLAAIEKAFRQLVNILPRNGLLLAGTADPAVEKLLPNSPAPVQKFGLEPGAHWQAVHVELSPEGQDFTLCRQGEELGRFFLPLSGAHNLRNALAALGAGFAVGLAADQLREGLRSFQGVRRGRRRSARWGTSLSSTILPTIPRRWRRPWRGCARRTPRARCGRSSSRPAPAMRGPCSRPSTSRPLPRRTGWSSARSPGPSGQGAIRPFRASAWPRGCAARAGMPGICPRPRRSWSIWPLVSGRGMWWCS